MRFAEWICILMSSAIPSYSKLIKPYRVVKPDKFNLKHWSPADTQSLELNPEERRDFHRKAMRKIDGMQQMLSADARWSVLLIIQAMDAAGKDSLIRHAMAGINPQGCRVHSFKQPSQEELSHDFLWRASKVLPERGHIGIFNRSHYEEVLVARVHPEILEAQRLPPSLTGRKIWKERFEDIAAYERYLVRNGVLIRKLFLYVSKEEQKRRFLSRLAEPHKNWKFSASDVRDRDFWNEYIQAYEDTIRHTASEEAPWYIIPADHKWFTRMVAISIIVEALESLKLSFPKVPLAQQSELESAREHLRNEDS
jgi:PPK2 family polyphosphate:nucleotide phosphotransferase